MNIPILLIGGYVALSIFAVVFGMIYIKLSSKTSRKEESPILLELQSKVKTLEENLRTSKQNEYGKLDNLQAFKVEVEAEIRQNSRDINILKEKLDRFIFESLTPKKEEKPVLAPKEDKVTTLKEMAVEAAADSQAHPKSEEPKKEEKAAEKAPETPPVDDVVALLQKKPPQG